MYGRDFGLGQNDCRIGGDKYYVMSFSEQENKIIKELSKEEAEKLIRENRQNEERQLEMAENFKKIFEKAKRK